MRTDFERELAELLHTVTPEPPDGMVAPRVAAPAEPTRTDADAAVIELTTGTRHLPSPWRRWPLALSAAAVAALAAGVVALVGSTGHSGPARPAGSGHSTGSVAPSVATEPACTNNQIVIAEGPPPFTRHGTAGTARVSLRNRSATSCMLVPPSVAIGTTPSGGTPFPGGGGTVRLHPNEQLVITAHVQVSGRCRPAKEGLRVNLTDRGWTYSYPLGVAGCTLTPVRSTRQLSG